MKATLEFDLVTERVDYEWAAGAGKLRAAIDAALAVIRQRLKYESPEEQERLTLMRIREVMTEELGDLLP
jgi:hypothetical protein